MTTDRMPPLHPGELLKLDFLEPLGITQYRLAKEIGVPPIRINEIVHGKRAVTVDTALRLSRYFGMTDTFWVNAQISYDLETARTRMATVLDGIRPLRATA